MQHYVYILICNDNSLYTGYTTDIQRRTIEHNNSNKGARYTQGRRPVSLAYSEILPTHSDALKREIQIKKMSRSQKILLISGYEKTR